MCHPRACGPCAGRKHGSHFLFVQQNLATGSAVSWRSRPSVGSQPPAVGVGKGWPVGGSTVFFRTPATTSSRFVRRRRQRQRQRQRPGRCTALWPRVDPSLRLGRRQEQALVVVPWHGAGTAKMHCRKVCGWAPPPPSPLYTSKLMFFFWGGGCKTMKGKYACKQLINKFCSGPLCGPIFEESVDRLFDQGPGLSQFSGACPFPSPLPPTHLTQMPIPLPPAPHTSHPNATMASNVSTHHGTT